MRAFGILLNAPSVPVPGHAAGPKLSQQIVCPVSKTAPGLKFAGPFAHGSFGELFVCSSCWVLEFNFCRYWKIT